MKATYAKDKEGKIIFLIDNKRAYIDNIYGRKTDFKYVYRMKVENSNKFVWINANAILTKTNN